MDFPSGSTTSTHSEHGMSIDDLRGRLGDFREQAFTFIRERPATSLLLAVGAGYLIGRILR